MTPEELATPKQFESLMFQYDCAFPDVLDTYERTFDALTAALDAKREMWEAIVRWDKAFPLGDEKLLADIELNKIAATPPDGTSARAQLAEANAEVERLRVALEQIARGPDDPRNYSPAGLILGSLYERVAINALADAATTVTYNPSDPSSGPEALANAHWERNRGMGLPPTDAATPAEQAP